MMKADVENEGDHAASSALSEKGKTTMSKLVENMAFLCSVYDMGFTVLVESHELVTRNNLSGKLHFVLADPLYCVQSD